MEPGFVSLEGVSHRYGGIQAGPEGVLAIQDLSININRGEFAAVVGPSGCGKSTLMKLATGLQFPFAGHVRVAGAEVTQPLKIAGMAFQAPTLLPWRTTLDNLLLPLEIVQPHRREIRRNKQKYVERAEALLASVGLGGFGSKYPWQLSGGMQQRTSLCRALIHDPRLLLLDEPFGALDAFTREDLWQVLQKLWMERNPTVILVTHDLREAVFLADTVHVMSARPGRVLVSHKVDIKRPRTLDDLFTEKASKLVHELRSHISHDRSV